jgi:hypothetical protein
MQDFIAVVMNISIFWDITPCNPLKISRRLGGTYRLHLQGRISRACHLSRWYLARLIQPWRWIDVPPKHRLSFNGLHGVISQKTVIFKVSTGSGAHPASPKMGSGSISPDAKRQRRETDRAPPSTAEVKTSEATSIIRLHGVVSS